MKRQIKNLIDKLDLIHSNESYKNIFTIAYMHGHIYNGPNYEVELEAVRKALDELDE